MRRLILGSLTALVLVTSGCGGDTSTGSTPTPAPSAPSSSTPASGDPATPSEPVSSTPTDTGVDPATGVTLTSAVAQVNAPAGWMTNPTLSDTGGNVNGPNGNALFNLALGDSESASSDESTDYAATLSQKSCCYQPPLERQPDLTLAGQPAYHLAGNDNIFGNWADEYGVRYQGHTVKVIISTPRDLPVAKRSALNESILASFQLKP